MPAKKIQDETEVMRWFREGRTYKWMIEQYQKKYNIETTIATWSNFRRRHGLDRRMAWDGNLIPWKVEAQHRYAYPILMLRKEARRRAGFDLSPKEVDEVEGFIRSLERDGAVIHYDPETKEGWFRVPRREGTDMDLIREPGRVLSNRKAG